MTTLLKQPLQLLHFNDVYNVSGSSHKAGGAGRFKTILNYFSPLDPLILFSGDFLSPSNMSTVTKGKHMIGIMNLLNISCGMIGNHDLDFGNDHCIKCFKQLNYPVLNSNIYEGGKNGKLLGDCLEYKIFDHKNYKICILGVSEDWTDTLPIKCENGYNYKEFVNYTKNKIVEINKKYDNKIDLMIALTHNRLLNDILLANNVSGLDLILGGHDHGFNHFSQNNCVIVKSGCDFKNLTWIQINGDSNNKKVNKIKNKLKKYLNNSKLLKGFRYNFETNFYDVKPEIKEDVEMSKLIEKLCGEYERKLKKPIGKISSDLDCRFSTVRSRESNVGNLICDIIRRAYRCDGVQICGGALRGDTIIEATKEFTMKHVLDIVPFQDPIVVLEIKGSQIKEALELAVSSYPKLDGRFPQVGGMRFIYDPKSSVNNRIKKIYISRYKALKSVISTLEFDYENINNLDEFEELDMNSYYRYGTREYMYNGGDGFNVFKSCKLLLSGEEGHPMSVLVRNFFYCVDLVNKFKKLNENENSNKLLKKKMLHYNVSPLKRLGSLITLSNSNNDEKKDNEFLTINCTVEGRIVTIDNLTNTKPISNYFRSLPSFIDMNESHCKKSVQNILLKMKQLKDKKINVNTKE